MHPKNRFTKSLIFGFAATLFECSAAWATPLTLTLTPPGPFYVSVGTNVFTVAQATDPNPGANLYVQIRPGTQPAGSFVSYFGPNAIFNWTPSTGQAGLYVVTFDAFDLSGGGSASQDLRIRVYEGSCCTGLTGNADCDPLDGVDISDLSALIDNLYINFTPLCCPAEANCDGQPGIDISDLSALIDYLYISFTPTAACQ